MTDVAIRVENLSKQYRISAKQSDYKTLRELLVEAVRSPFRRLSSVAHGQSTMASDEAIWALKDVSFELRRGEVVSHPLLRCAIIGHNERQNRRTCGGGVRSGWGQRKSICSQCTRSQMCTCGEESRELVYRKLGEL